MIRVVYIGNFSSPHTIESRIAWSLQTLNIPVTFLQEDKTTGEEIVDEAQGASAVFYTHTHGWKTPRIIWALYKLEKRGTPTVSIHLDRWAGLDREVDVGKEPMWKTKYLFLADGSPEAEKLYAKHNLNWFYFPPAIVEKECYRAKPDPIRFPHPIVFIGSSEYHKEYPFRSDLISWLKRTYGDAFAHYGVGSKRGIIQGHDLNVLCATAKIVVGDSCFAGSPRYVSDQYYEIRGRGGVLLHPHVEGVDTEGVIPYKPKNLVSIKMSIAYAMTHDAYREEMREKGFLRVSSSETYTQRVKKILETIL